MTQQEILGVVCVLAIQVGILLILLGLQQSSRTTRCFLCHNPMPTGYTAWNNGRPLCRDCTKRSNLVPWYHKPELGTPWQ